MVQQWQAATGYTLQELGIAPWVTKAQQQAQKVLQLVTVRVDNESAKVKGELAAARRATDEAIRRAYDILNALAVLQPTQELTQLVTVLLGIEDRAKLYYISGGKTGGDRPTPTPTPDGGSSDGDGVHRMVATRPHLRRPQPPLRLLLPRPLRAVAMVAKRDSPHSLNRSIAIFSKK